MVDNKNTQDEKDGTTAEPPKLSHLPTVLWADPDIQGGSYTHPGSQNQETKTSKWFRSPDWWIVIFTGLLFFAAAVTACLLLKQINESETDSRKQRRYTREQIETMRTQVDAVRGQMRQEQRGWIKIELGPLSTRENPTAGTVIPFVPVIISNTGKSPANHIVGKFIVEKVPNGHPPSFRYDPATSRTVTIGSIWQGTDLPAWDIYMLRIKPGSKEREIRSLTTTENDEILKGKAYIATHGRVDYDDIFGGHHWTTICAFSTEDTPVTIMGAEACTNYTGVDNNQ